MGTIVLIDKILISGNNLKNERTSLNDENWLGRHKTVKTDDNIERV